MSRPETGQCCPQGRWMLPDGSPPGTVSITRLRSRGPGRRTSQCCKSVPQGHPILSTGTLPVSSATLALLLPLSCRNSSSDPLRSAQTLVPLPRSFPPDKRPAWSHCLVAATGDLTWDHGDSPVASDFLRKPSALSMKSLVSKLYPSGLEPSTSRLAGEAGGPALSARVLQEMAKAIAATQHSKMHDWEGSSGRSSHHLLEEMALDCRDLNSSTTPDPSLADRRWPHAGRCRDRSVERKTRKKRSPSLPGSVQLVGGRWPGHSLPTPRAAAGGGGGGQNGGQGFAQSSGETASHPTPSFLHHISQAFLSC